ncbi:MAG TPA: hypothetical protein VN426_15465 [Syntrophomonadaceae bacterium]|nr:hypothetical protein [Syntrophomonadaceae bacterium]
MDEGKKRSPWFRVHLTQKTRDKFQSVAEHYGVSASALGAYLVINFLSQQDKPDTLDALMINIKPADLWQVFGE